ncbi:hypothetical protein [Enterococcus termitis]|uniref:Uncharacterized protein n=1 Tax=Enterococcus termitis TaxID=332950 RepID=A0A1E5GU20_9ENTE|nr:hypothetical protein [Enterococcus termitis]OEG16157.1 hypothetical protein BCR25_18350 [Enterococcus termitis]OJG96822.1 hypothetical protein RV18_GL001868 [Enterococcus termitis]
MDQREEKAARRKLLLYHLYMEDEGFPGAAEMVRKIGKQIKDPKGTKIEVIYPDGNIITYYGLPTVQKRCRIGSNTLPKLLHSGEPDRKGRRYRYA